jgi:hypothetical protein
MEADAATAVQYNTRAPQYEAHDGHLHLFVRVDDVEDVVVHRDPSSSVATA